jgi:hypothetical protein
MSVGRLSMLNETQIPIEDLSMSDPTNLSLRDQVVAWLRMNNYSRASFERICGNVVGAATFFQLNELVRDNPTTFRAIKIRGGIPGLALLDNAPATNAMPVEEVMQVTDVQVAPLETETVAAPEAVTEPNEPEEPRIGDIISMDGVQSIVALVPLTKPTPSENVEELIAMAVGAETSSAAENYANASFLAAQAIAVLAAAKSL